MYTKKDLESMIVLIDQDIMKHRKDESKQKEVKHLEHTYTQLQEEYLRRFNIIYEPLE